VKLYPLMTKIWLYHPNNLGQATHRPEGLNGLTWPFDETFGTFPLLFEMILFADFEKPGL